MNNVVSPQSTQLRRSGTDETLTIMCNYPRNTKRNMPQLSVPVMGHQISFLIHLNPKPILSKYLAYAIQWQKYDVWVLLPPMLEIS